MTSNPETLLLHGLEALQKHTICLGLQQVKENFFLLNSRDGWVRPAQMFSANVGGSVYPSHDGFTWVPNNKMSFYVREHTSYKAIKEAHKAVSPLGLKLGYSVPSIARKVIEYVGKGTRPAHSCARFLEDIKLGYHDCVPGIYEHTALYDVSSCYFQMLCKLKSLHCVLIEDTVHFTDTPPDEWVRWLHVLELVKDAKALRNTIWGCMLGTTGKVGVLSFHRGQARRGGVHRGSYFGVAALVGRSAWELNRDAAEETAAVYSQTDCVATARGQPRTWEYAGLNIKLKAEGESEFCRRGCYCPDLARPETATVWYDRGSRIYEPVARTPRKSIIYYEQWML